MTTQPGEDQKMFVINNHEKMSAAKMALAVGVSVTWVNKFCDWMQIEPKRILGPVSNVRTVKDGIQQLEKVFGGPGIYYNPKTCER